MEESFFKSFVAKIALAILAIALVDLFFLNWWILKNQKLKAGNIVTSRSDDSIDIEVASASAQLIQSANPTPQASPEIVSKEPKTIVEKEVNTVVQTAQKEIFIPIGSGSTKNTTFAYLAGVEVTIDTSKYSNIESVVFEASVWIEGGNGRAWARLVNISDNNPLVESQISNTTGDGVVKTSNNIPLPSGSKKYGVQAKTEIENFAAHVDNARIKITLR